MRAAIARRATVSSALISALRAVRPSSVMGSPSCSDAVIRAFWQPCPDRPPGVSLRGFAHRKQSCHHHQGMRAIAKYFRANPQVFLLFMVCVVLGLGTFIAVLVALVQSGNTTPSGEPSGVIAGVGGVLGALAGR